MKAFSSEDQIHGYMLGMLRAKETEYKYDLKREVPTSVKYSKTEDGILIENPNGTGGYIDIWLKSESECIGIELEYPRGSGRTNPVYFTGHIKNDCIKLSNEYLDRRIVLLFIYQDPPVSFNEINNIVKEFPDISFLYLRLRRQDEFESPKDSSVLDLFMYPENWIDLPVVPSR